MGRPCPPGAGERRALARADTSRLFAGIPGGLCRGGLAIGAGGAIVAGSEPEEMVLKARPLLEAVGGTLERDRRALAVRIVR